MTINSPFLLIGAMFSALAALTAFLITYEEWTHHYSSAKEPLKHAIEAAIVAFVVFMIITILVSVFVVRFL